VYSALYNGVFMGANTLITLLVFALLWGPLNRFFQGEDIAE
jgi:thiamine transporter ThiT